MLPDDPESTILKRLKRPKGDEEPADGPADQQPDRRSGLDAPATVALR
jgi:membrane protein required for colicin V production